MSRGYWYAGLSALGILLVAGAIFAAAYSWPEAPNITKYQEVSEGSGSYYPGGAACQPKQLASIRSGRKRQAKADECQDKAEAFYQQQIANEYSLHSAKGAESGNLLAFSQAKTSAIGLILSAFSVAFTGWAALEAAKAAQAARDAVEDSRADAKEEAERFARQLDLTKTSVDASIALELPYLRAAIGDLMEMNKPVPAQGGFGGTITSSVPGRYSSPGDVYIKNYGRTNAYPIRFGLGWTIAEKLPEDPRYSQIAESEHDAVVRPITEDAESDFRPGIYITVEISEAERHAMIAGGSWLWVYGFLQYNDFMDNLWEARFCWRYANRNPPGDPEHFYFDRDGQPPKGYTKKFRVGI